MKRLVSTELGGHPLTLKDVGFLQDVAYDAMKQQVIALVGTAPCILWGMQKSISVSTLNTICNVSEGAYWDGTEILRHPAATLYYPVNTMSVNVFLYINTNNAVLPPATYKNGVVKNVYQERYIESVNLVSTTINLDAQPRMDNILKQRLGINTLTGNVNTLSSNYTNLNGIVSGHTQDISGLNQNINDHINLGGHTYKKITDRPFLYGSAYLGDIGVTSPAFPHVMGSNCKRVAGTVDDSLYEIMLPNNAIIGTSGSPGAYHVYGSMVGTKVGWGAGNYGGWLWNEDNDVAYVVGKKDFDRFHVAVRGLGPSVQSLWFEFQVAIMSKV